MHGTSPKLEFSCKTRHCPLLEAAFLTQVDMSEHLGPRQGPFRGLATSAARLLHVAARDSLESALKHRDWCGGSHFKRLAQTHFSAMEEKRGPEWSESADKCEEEVMEVCNFSW